MEPVAEPVAEPVTEPVEEEPVTEPVTEPVAEKPVDVFEDNVIKNAKLSIHKPICYLAL